MKKTFRSILAGAVALLAVSCYDDSALRKQNELLKDQLDDLKESLVDASEFGIDRDELFLMYSAEKSLNLIAEGVAEYSVMNEPDGWQATIEGTTLKIVAPAKEAYEHGAAALKGEISIHATSNTGACKVAKIAVESGEGLRLVLGEGGNLTIKNAFVSENEFETFAIGIMPASQWYTFESSMEMTFKEAWEKYPDMIGNIAKFYADYYYHHSDAKGTFAEGTYEVDTIETSVAQLYTSLFYEEPAKGVYVVFATHTEKGMPTDFVEVLYTDVEFSLAVENVTSDDATINFTASGHDGYVFGCVSEKQFANMAVPSFDGYMTNGEGPWTLFKKYGATEPIGMYIPAESFTLSEMIGQKLQFGTKYYIWVMPMYDYLAKWNNEYEMFMYDAYDYDIHLKPYVREFTTPSLTAGGPDTDIVAAESAYESVSATITLEEGEIAYYGFFTKDEYLAFASEEEKVKAIIDQNDEVMATGRDAQVIYETGNISYKVDFASEDDVYCIAFTVKNGQYGECGEVVLKAKQVTRNSNISITLTSITQEGTNYVAVFNVQGAAKLALLNMASSESNINGIEDAVFKQFYSSYYRLSKFVNVTDNVATVTFASSSSKTHMIVTAYNVDSSNVLTDIATAPVVFDIAAELAK